MGRPLIVVHTAGQPGMGGPSGVSRLLMQSRLGEDYRFAELHQEHGFGGISPRAIAAWTDHLSMLQPDLIRISGLGNEAFHAMAAARRAGIPKRLLVVHASPRDLEPHSANDRLRKLALTHALEPATLRMATHVVPICDYAANRPFVRRHARRLLPAIPNGTPIPQLSPQRRRADRQSLGWNDDIIVVYVGRLSVQKGLADLAAAGWHDPRVRLVIVGDGPDRELLRRLFDRSPWRAEFLGLRHNVSDYLGAADLFVLPSWHENSSNALLEAMAHHLPVVATAVGGTPEIVTGAGVLVPPHAPDALGAALRAVIDGDLQTGGEVARQRVVDRYTLDRCVDRWDRAFRQVLAS